MPATDEMRRRYMYKTGIKIAEGEPVPLFEGNRNQPSLTLGKRKKKELIFRLQKS